MLKETIGKKIYFRNRYFNKRVLNVYDLGMFLFQPQHSTPTNAYGSVKAYTNFDADRDALNIETAIKTKGR